MKLHTILLFALVALGGFVSGEINGQPSQNSETNNLYLQFIQEKNRGQNSVQSNKIWIAKFEDALSNSSVADPVHYHILFSLAELYDTVGKKNLSEELYFQVFRSDKASLLLRAVAGENLVSMSRMHPMPSKFSVIDFLPDFEYIVSHLGNDNKFNFLPSIQRNRILWADSILEDRQKTFKHLQSENLHQDAFFLMRETYISVIDVLLKSVTEYSLLNSEQKDSLMRLNFGIDNTLFHLGKAGYELGVLYTNNNEKDKGNSQFDLAQKVLLNLLREYGKDSLFASKAVVLFLKIQDSSRGMGNQEFVQSVKDMCLYVQENRVKQSMHTVHNYLLDCAMLLSKEGTREIASELYDFIISQEKKCFPNEYSSNLNYQLALASKASNFSEIGNADEMRKSIKELESCKTIDGKTQEFIADTVKRSNERVIDTSFPVLDSSRNLFARILLIVSGVVLIIAAIIIIKWAKW
jgi:hypothetical protein